MTTLQIRWLDDDSSVDTGELMGWSLEDVAKALGPSARVNNGVLELELINPDGTKAFYPYAACIQYIHTEAARRATQRTSVPTPPPLL